MALLDDARQGRCALHLPVAAVLEARRPLKRVKDDLVNDLTTLRDRLSSAARHGFPGLRDVYVALESETLRRYVEREPPDVLDELRATPGVFVISDVPVMLDSIEEVRRRVPFDGRDIVDIYVLATIVAHRRLHPSPPGLFFSTDARAFRRDEVRKLLAHDRLLWRSDFELGPSLAEWRVRFATP